MQEALLDYIYIFLISFDKEEGKPITFFFWPDSPCQHLGCVLFGEDSSKPPRRIAFRFDSADAIWRTVPLVTHVDSLPTSPRHILTFVAVAHVFS